MPDQLEPDVVINKLNIPEQPVHVTVPKAETPAMEARKAEAQAQDDRVAHGQRKVNILWEITQSAVAIMVVVANLAVMVNAGFAKSETAVKIPEALSNALFLVIGFYFSRTNHTAVGGVGPKPIDDYRGR